MIPISTRAAEFREQFPTRRWVADGAMATQLFAKGAPTNKPVEELNLSLAASVRNVHREYLAAGAQIISTNTFGANRMRLEQAGLGGKLADINRAAVRIAREVAQDRAFVAGVIGPTGVRLAPLGKLTADEARAVFRQHAVALAGVDLFVLETFRDVAELRAAVDGVRDAAGPDVIVVAQISVEEDGTLGDGVPVSRYGPALDALNADAVGMNCSSGPHAVAAALDELSQYTGKPLSVAPGAGWPRACSPEYFAGVLRDAPAAILGACCGSTPDHIRALASIAEQRLPRRHAASEADVPVEPPGSELPPTRLAEKLAAKQFVTIAERDGSKPPDAFGVSTFAQPVPLIAAQRVQNGETESLLYVAARGRNARQLQGELLAAHESGIRNILCITGIGGGSLDIDSIGLTHIAASLNRGVDLAGNIVPATKFTIGVAADPGAANLDEEVARFAAKVRAGAQFAVTQPIFDVALFRTFVKRTNHAIPVIASVWPITNAATAEWAANELGIPIPSALRTRIAEGDGPGVTKELATALRSLAAGLRIVHR